MRLLVLENIFLIPSYDIYLLVGAYIKYRVGKLVQGKMIGICGCFPPAIYLQFSSCFWLGLPDTNVSRV